MLEGSIQTRSISSYKFFTQLDKIEAINVQITKTQTFLHGI